MEFELLQSDPAGARAGVIRTPHAELPTPYFQPVATAGAIKGLSWRTMRALGYPHVLMNTYHLLMKPGMEKLNQYVECGSFPPVSAPHPGAESELEQKLDISSGALRSFTGWGGGILTDSGGYQVFSLAKKCEVNEWGAAFQSHIDGSVHAFTPKSVAEAQVLFGSDVAMPLDICTPHDAGREKTESDLARTTVWMSSAKKWWDRHKRPGTAMFGIVQGGVFPDLREKAACEAVGLDFPGYAVGGLSVGESDDLFAAMARHTCGLLPADKPRYLMGVGTPADIIRAIGWGYDMFDCVLPTRMARHHVAYTRFGKVDLRKTEYSEDTRPLDPGCRCAVCLDHSRAYLHHLAKLHEINAPVLLTLHNLHFYRELVSKARGAILKGTFRAFAREWLVRLGEWNEKRDE